MYSRSVSNWRLVDRGADVNALLHAIADLELPGTLHQRGHETIVDGLLDDHAAGGGALLPGGEEGGVDTLLDGGVEVGVGENDGGVLPAHLQLNAQAALAGFGVEPVADLAGAGERDRLERRGAAPARCPTSPPEPATKFTTPLGMPAS